MHKDKNNPPLVSVIICVYNGEKYLEEAIKSALSENYPQMEILCIDDGSTDSTMEILRNFGSAIKISSQQNQGIAAARNFATKIAQGEFITYLDSDDLFVPGRIAAMADTLLQNPETAMVFGQIKQFITPELIKSFPAKIVTEDNILTGMCPGGIMYRSNIFQQVGEFEKGNHTAYFLDWSLKAKEKGLVEKYLNQVVTLRRIHSTNSSITHKNNFSTESTRAIKAHLDRVRGGE